MICVWFCWIKIISWTDVTIMTVLFVRIQRLYFNLGRVFVAFFNQHGLPIISLLRGRSLKTCVVYDCKFWNFEPQNDVIWSWAVIPWVWKYIPNTSLDGTFQGLVNYIYVNMEILWSFLPYFGTDMQTGMLHFLKVMKYNFK